MSMTHIIKVLMAFWLKYVGHDVILKQDLKSGL